MELAFEGRQSQSYFSQCPLVSILLLMELAFEADPRLVVLHSSRIVSILLLMELAFEDLGEDNVIALVYEFQSFF